MKAFNDVEKFWIAVCAAIILFGIAAITVMVTCGKADAEETYPFPVYMLDKNSLYLESDTVGNFNEYNRQQRELDREYQMSQELNKAPAPPQNLIAIPDPPKHKIYKPFQD